MRGLTDAHKVCFDCPSCGGRQVTLPVLREALGNAGVAALMRVARALEHPGCVCPGCGATMGLARVGIDGRKVEIDVCGACLSVWCDGGEYDVLVPKRPPPRGKPSMAELARRASPEARERLAEAMLKRVPEDVSPDDFGIGDVLMDVVRIVVGAPTLWRTVRPVTPIVSALMLLGLAVLHPVLFYASRNLPGARTSHAGGLFWWSDSYRYWRMDEAMATFGLSASSLSSFFTFPFVQNSGDMAICHAVLVFAVLVVVERRAGHSRAFALLAAFWAAAAVSHLLAATVGWASGALCGIAPIEVGFCAFVLAAYPEAQLSWGGKDRMPLDVLASLVLLGRLVFALLDCLGSGYASVGFVPSVVCLALGAGLAKARWFKG